MKRYIVFLEGINVSGKNKISMSGLEAGFGELDLVEVRTYLSSGDVIFSSDDEEDFSGQLETIIKDRFDLDMPVFVILKEELEDILHNASDWWGTGNREIYDNLISIVPPATFTEVFSGTGEPKEEFEKIRNCKKTVFWSFSQKDYRETGWWSRTASASISNKLTIRTANTVGKIVEM